ncbi:MAG: 16S rRNA (uracil(1498)-N(3))-methyltransferase [Planctomycetota bacterium]
MAHRYFVDRIPDAKRTLLEGDTAHHLKRVLRVRPGSVVVLGDGRGLECPARIHSCTAAGVEVELGQVRAVAAHSPRVELAFAVPRMSRADWLFEHATEAGVAAFHPLRTARSRPGEGRADRWLRICRAAAGQCDRAHVPLVHEIRDLAEFLADPSLPCRRLLASPEGERALAAIEDTVLLVGPEGGLDPQERAAAARAGFSPVRLGPPVLRTETAALVGAALLLA